MRAVDRLDARHQRFTGRERFGALAALFFGFFGIAARAFGGCRGIAPARILAVGYLEVGSADTGRYDERVQTAAAEREDPCLAFKR